MNIYVRSSISILLFTLIFLIIIRLSSQSLYIITHGIHIRRCESVSSAERMSILKKMYNLLATEFDKNDINVWLEYGTLLGYLRQKDLICYDYDIDFGALYKDNEKIKTIMENIVSNNPEYSFQDIGISPYLIRKHVLVHTKTEINADIFYYDYVGDDIITRGIFYKPLGINSNATKKSKWIFPLKKIRFLNMNIYIPNDPSELFTFYYGENHLIPDHMCDSTCDRCVKI